ncbi:MAG: class I SAM-dependent DNA methyltransferase, partial [Lachnospiraceae bacterium]|nr:class I SAM-dependent DNA methyltransferase [Lachnospiraceae bacterium]
IEYCYSDEFSDEVLGIKDENDDWNTKGNINRIIHVTKRELMIFAKVFDGNEKWKEARLPLLQDERLLQVLERFVEQNRTLESYMSSLGATEMWHETNAQKDGTIVRKNEFPEKPIELIYSGPNIWVSNPFYKAIRREYNSNNDYDTIDLEAIKENYRPRCGYAPKCDISTYIDRAPVYTDGTKGLSHYRIFMRNMFGLSGERTLISALVPPDVGHVHAVYEIALNDVRQLVLLQGCMSSIVYDFYIKALGKGSGGINVIKNFPMFSYELGKEIVVRTLMLNCLNVDYKELWEKCWDFRFKNDTWAKSDSRLNNNRFYNLEKEWKLENTLRSEYERREALIEIDVLVAKLMGLTLDELITIYKIQFPNMQTYDKETWFDQNGRIVFSQKSYGNIVLSRNEWEKIRDEKEGVFYHKFSDDTLPNGPIERSIEYIAPFEKCNRENDYREIWNAFELRSIDNK